MQTLYHTRISFDKHTDISTVVLPLINIMLVLRSTMSIALCVIKSGTALKIFVGIDNVFRNTRVLESDSLLSKANSKRLRLRSSFSCVTMILFLTWHAIYLLECKKCTSYFSMGGVLMFLCVYIDASFSIAFFGSR